jgi:hypothetical protein
MYCKFPLLTKSFLPFQDLTSSNTYYNTVTVKEIKAPPLFARCAYLCFLEEAIQYCGE